MIGSDTICRNRWADNNMKCELKVLKEAPRRWFSVDSWKTLGMKVVGLGLMLIIAKPIADFCEVSHINTFCVGGILALTMYLLAWCRCRKE